MCSWSEWPLDKEYIKHKEKKQNIKSKIELM